MDARERNDLLLKLMLVLVRDRRAMQGRIRSVGYFREYGELPDDLGVMSLSRLNDEEVAALADSVGIRKAPAGAKSDIYLNDLGYTIQSFAERPPVLLENVDRDGLAFACGQANVPAAELNECMEQYWRLRQEGAVGEAVANGEPASPFRDKRGVFVPVLSYFLFTGDERSVSHLPAEFVFDYTDPLNTNTWSIYDPQQTFDLLWERLVFTVAGSPENWTLTVRATA